MRTLFIDMDGTLTDLDSDRAFFTESLPRRYAQAKAMDYAAAERRVAQTLAAVYGTLAWYSIPNLSRFFGFDLAALSSEFTDSVKLQAGALDFLVHAGVLIDDNLRAVAAARRAGLATITITRPDLGRPAQESPMVRRSKTLPPSWSTYEA